MHLTLLIMAFCRMRVTYEHTCRNSLAHHREWLSGRATECRIWRSEVQFLIWDLELFLCPMLGDISPKSSFFDWKSSQRTEMALILQVCLFSITWSWNCMTTCPNNMKCCCLCYFSERNYAEKKWNEASSTW